MNGYDKCEEAKAEITAINYENKGRCGYRRITMELHNRRIPLNHKTVQRLMKELGLVCRVRMKKCRSYEGEAGKIVPNLLKRDFSTTAPNQKWVTDVTEFSLFGEKLYLSPILELHSSDLVSYVISEQPVLSMVMNMADSAARWLPPEGSSRSALRSGPAVPAQVLPEEARRSRHHSEHVSQQLLHLPHGKRGY